MNENLNSVQQNEESSMTLSDIWHLIWDYKWWYVLSVAVCIMIAVFYLYVTPPEYVRVAKVIINEDVQSNVMSDLITMAGGVGSDSFSSNANNEAEAFASPDLMEKVVRRLALETAYTEDQGIRKVSLYDSTPVAMTIVDSLAPVYFSFRMVRTGDDTFLLKNFQVGPDKVRKVRVEGRLGENVRTPAGTIRLDPTPYFEDWDRDILVSWAYPMARAKYYASNLVVTVTGKNSTVLALTMTDRFISRAERVLNTLIDVYNEEWIHDKNRAARSTSDFISERVKIIEGELSGIETDLKDYKEKNNLTDIQALGQAYLEELGEYSAKEFEVTNQLAIAGFIRDYLTDPKNDRSLLPSNSGLSNQSVESQISDYNELYLEREKLILNSSADNPLIEDMTLALDAIRSAVLTSIENLMGTLELQASQIKDEESKILSGMASSSGQEMDLLSIERQQQVKQSLYLYLLQKREENDITALMNVGNTRVIVTPNGSTHPSSPNTLLVLAAALILGAFLPMGILILAHSLDCTIRSREDISRLSVSFLAEIPLMPGARRWRALLPALRRKKFQKASGTGIVVEKGKRDVMNEAFRMMRTNLDFMTGQKDDTKVILFSSFNPGSGKTFVSMNLAASLAIKGTRIALLDLDLRKGTMSKTLKLKGEGISMYLSGNESSIDRVTVKFAENLDVIPAGILPPNPSELLVSDRFAELVLQLRRKYDYVFLDCPPVDIVADTSIIARMADMTIFVMRAGLMDKRALPMVDEVAKGGLYPRMSVVLNGVAQKEGRYGYGRYGYGYGYKYEYR